MGIGKLGRKLIKVGRRTGKKLGKHGRELTEAVLERAISILEAELKRAGQGGKAAHERNRRRPAVKASLVTGTAQRGPVTHGASRPRTRPSPKLDDEVKSRKGRVRPTPKPVVKDVMRQEPAPPEGQTTEGEPSTSKVSVP